MQPLWRKIQQQNFTDWKKLAELIQLDLPLPPNKLKFPLNLPVRLAKKIRKATPDDPILRQFLPSFEENKKSPLFISDPVGDTNARKAPKLLHKYQGRALLVSTSACAMHCRYCFRQHFDYETEDKSFSEELEYIRQDSTLKEIILSGGDPLSLSDRQLKSLIDNLAQIPHLKRLRFHTRFPIGIPERIDAPFLELLKTCRLQTFFVVHSNHPNEWDEEISAALKNIQKLGIPVLCQTILLKNVNDNADTLHAFFEFLVDQGILPYYLHQLDRVEGASHFEVSEEEGKAFMQELSRRLSGYAVPRYVQEIAGESSKTPISF
ncbi:MAG: EF-P beta-lysylation protein EpmB [Rhabdochlamydiaceae bacterium]|nr:EF-P beta-lysylation protein EpmB [Rhabdochlamydiaceae bacterium]